MIYILYSADYELYLGGLSRSEEEVLIQPTEQLLATCERLAIPLTLFADMACLWRYQELGKEHFPAMASAQLLDAACRHHDIQTHLHPHWGFTSFQEGRFLFDADKYLLGTVDPDPKQRFHLTQQWLQRASDSLTSLIQPHIPTYRCLAFRAGGYGLQPDDKMILKALLATGYRIDSSIIPGWQMTTNVQQIDFTQVPNQPNYWLSEEGGLTTPAPWGTGIFAIPIGACTLNTWDRLTLNGPAAVRMAWATLKNQPQNPPSRGQPCNLPPDIQPRSRWQHAYWRAQSQLATRFIRLELGTNPKTLLSCLHHYLEKYQQQEATTPIFLSLNCHPKGLHQPHLEALERFQAGLIHQYQGNIQAITFQQAWNLIST